MTLRPISARVLAIGLVLAIECSGRAPPAWADALVIQGSTTFNSLIMEPYRKAIEEQTGHSLTVVPNKSSVGLLALFEQRGNMAMISTALTAEVAAMKSQKAAYDFSQLRSFSVGRVRMSFPVHPENKVRALPNETMKRILAGQIDNWEQVGDINLPIRVVMVREGGGVQASVEKELLDGKPVSVKEPILVQIGSQVVAVVRQQRSALGLAQLGHVRKAHLPEISLETPVTQELNFVTLGEPTAAMWAVINATKTAVAEALN